MCEISVIIPAYNAEAYLRKAVESVLAQPCQHIHIVIVNDGSTDHTAALCDEIAAEDSRVAVLHQDNKGVSCARNAGIAWVLAHAEITSGYIGFCDADDLWKAGCVTQSILEDALREKADIVGFSCWCTDQEAKRYRVDNQYQSRVLALQKRGSVDGLLNGPFCAHLYSVKMIQRFALRFPEKVARNEDVIFMRQAVFCASRIVYREETLYLYRTNRKSVTHRLTDPTKTMLDICRAWNRAAHWAGDDAEGDAWQQMCLSTAAAVLLETARLMAERGAGSKYIFSVISGEPYFKEIDALSVDHLAYWQQLDLVLFRKNYKKFCRKHQLRGTVKKIARLLLYIPFVRNKRDERMFPFVTEG